MGITEAEPVKKHSIQGILTHHLKDREGLDYAAFVRVKIDPEGNDSLDIMHEGHHEQIPDLLVRFAMGSRTDDEQVELWGKLIREVHAAMNSLDKHFIRVGQGRNVRVVFDVDMGGIYCTRIGSYAFVFGATLDQAEVNNRRCEEDMRKIVSEIEAIFTAHGT